MHIPDHMLHGAICPVSAVVGAVVIIAAVRSARRCTESPSVAAFGAVSALLFIIQMMNFPLFGGISGHVLGGVLAASLLGTPFAVLALAMVISVQALVFSDGGLSVLGVNLFNMAILGAGVGGWMREWLLSRWRGGLGRIGATAVAAWISVMLAALAISVELTIGGRVAFSQIAPLMLGMHALIGMVEAVATVVVVSLISSALPAAHATARLPVKSMAMSVALLAMAPSVSHLPDVLQRLAVQYDAWHEAAPAFAGILANYSMPNVESSVLAFALSGLVGMLITYLLGWLAANAVSPVKRGGI